MGGYAFPGCLKSVAFQNSIRISWGATQRIMLTVDRRVLLERGENELKVFVCCYADGHLLAAMETQR